MYIDQFGVFRFQFFWGDLQNSPRKNLKNLKFSKMGPLTPYNTPFLLHNPVVWSKIGCLQKTRAQKVKI